MKITVWLIAIAAAAGLSACSNVKPEDCDPNKIGLLKTGLCEASGATAQREQELKKERDSQREIASNNEAQLAGLTAQQRLMRDRVISTRGKLADLQRRVDALKVSTNQDDAEIEELENRLNSVNREAAQLEADSVQPASAPSDITQRLERLREERADLEDLLEKILLRS